VTSAGAVLDQARSQIGYHEAPNGSNKFGQAYGMDKVAWCNEFVWWCFQQAGGGNLIPKSAYTPTTASWYQQRGLAGKTPRVGALVFYDWPGDGVNRISHIGIVEAVNADGTITTIEGNTTSGTGGNQSDGGYVARRKRSTSAVVIYAYPAYDGGAAPATPSAPADAGSMATLQYGMRTDSRVAAFQRQSNDYNWQPELPLLEPLGNYLDQTKDVVRRAQAQMGITGSDADGSIIGPRTKTELAKRGFHW
jgi:hypothetical protein